jgi:hypothetical protein
MDEEVEVEEPGQKSQKKGRTIPFIMLGRLPLPTFAPPRDGENGGVVVFPPPAPTTGENE